jgi:hypothetical protein
VIKVVGRSDRDEWLLDVGIDVPRLMSTRPEQYTIFSIGDNRLTLVFADDASSAAGIVIGMIRQEQHALMDAPFAVREILANHNQSGCH